MKHATTVHTGSKISGWTVAFMKKWELSLMFAIAVTLVWCAVSPRFTPMWWTTAFEPLCGGILSAGGTGDGIVLRSKFLELVQNGLF